MAKGKPLKNLKIGVVGKLPMKRTEMNAAIKQLGGAVVTKASKDTFVVISDQGTGWHLRVVILARMCCSWYQRPSRLVWLCWKWPKFVRFRWFRWISWRSAVEEGSGSKRIWKISWNESNSVPGKLSRYARFEKERGSLKYTAIFSCEDQTDH